MLPERRQHVDRVEDTAKIGQRREHEGRHDRDVVEAFGVNTVDKTGQREQDGGEHNHAQHHPQVVNVDRGEAQRHQCNRHADGQPTCHAAGDETGQNDVIRHRCDQHFLDVALEFRAVEGRHHVGVGIGDHGHHDEPGDNEFHVAESLHVTNARANEIAEDNEIQRRGNHRRQHRLDPDACIAQDFLGQDGAKCDEFFPPGHG